MNKREYLHKMKDVSSIGRMLKHIERRERVQLMIDKFVKETYDLLDYAVKHIPEGD